MKPVRTPSTYSYVFFFNQREMLNGRGCGIEQGKAHFFLFSDAVNKNQK